MMYSCLRTFNGTLHIDELAEDPPLVREIQQLLKTAGFYTGAIDGKFEVKSLEAFQKFKRAAFLEFPNLFGKSTAEALLEVASVGNHPTPSDITTNSETVKSPYLRLPTGEAVILGSSIIGCKNFTWNEATKNGSRVPATKQIVQTIIATASYLERVRSLFGNRRIKINSWYRPPQINRAVGGVSNSFHLLGNAVDFVIDGTTPIEVYARLNNWHGARGGLGRNTAFTHLDLRGYYARFNYGK